MATTSNATKKDSIKLTTPVFRASFANVFKPRVPFEGQEAVYSVEMLFDKKGYSGKGASEADKKSGDMKWLKAAIKQVADAKWGEGKWPKNFKSPIKDGDEKELEGYPGNFFLTVKSKQKPGIVDRQLNEIIDPSEFYSGCYAKATVVVKWYSTAGNNGVAVYLSNLQKFADGEAFSGKRNAKDDFDALEELDGTESMAEDAGGQADDYDF